MCCLLRKIVLCYSLLCLPAVAFTQEITFPTPPSSTSPAQTSSGPNQENTFSPFVILITLCGMLMGGVLTTTGLRIRMARQQRKLIATEQRLNFILDSVDAYVYVKNKDYQYVYANRKMCADLGLSLEQVQGKSDYELYHHPVTQAELRNNDREVLLHGKQLTTEETLRDSQGTISHVFLSVKAAFVDPQTKELMICGVSTDLTGIKAIQSENHKLTYYDQLTDLPNRHHASKALDALLSQAVHTQPYVLYILDLDRFQHINDARGHALGDMLLLKVANRLRTLLSKHHLLARLGGDEFCILYPLNAQHELSVQEQASHLGESIRQHLEQPYLITNYSYVISASIGWTLLRPELTCANEALREADTALSQAKQDGRNLVRAYQDTMHHALEEKLSLKHDLLHAIEQHQLRLFVQSQFDAKGNITGAEALLRWQHPERGDIGPSKFIPLAEDMDLISPLGDWLLSNICQLLNDTRHYPFPLSINISPAQFNHADFATRVHNILLKHTDQAHRLIMEVTEGTLMEDIPAAIQLMTDLTKLGVRFSIDDFGVGYSNLSALQRLPLYELKLDRSLIHGAPHDKHSCAIVQAVIAMAKQLQLHVVVEGIEKQEQLDFLLPLGDIYLQGYLLTQPMSIEHWLGDIRQRMPLA
ncbi:putative bifunctional diguanylate cyclase/phosphodiesterase [Alcaligenes endophyticus]|uniref:EAL domain-containing protein n=1 Tax=Alcaligenes endophyticus TaxID=1929088 RepID=A0ABT8EER7_9BURK|nr:GGDEF domain-containing phosphodiesterase [Alcaligenes endophyticus]MCX5592260.1 EAL domain-containing protein [Alcaligenes endophyticus]MDN4119702.1 EAL domain-containing protein [Alcaligenes endophyticus]